MSPLNDAELDALLRQAKEQLPRPSPGFDERVTRKYQEQIRRSRWDWMWRRPVAIPAGFGLLAGLLLVASGAVLGRTLLAPAASAAPRVVTPLAQERVVYRECTYSPEGPTSGLSFDDLQPVREMHPRVVRSMEDDQ